MNPSTQPGNCTKCQNLPTQWPSTKITTFEHHKTFKALSQSAAACPLCRIIRQLLIFQVDVDKLINSTCPVIVQVSGQSSISIALGSSEDLGVSAYGMLEVMKVGASATIPSNDIYRFHPADQTQESENLIKSCIKPWVKTCCADTPNPDPPLPTRVIDVTGRETVRLLEPTPKRGQYLILSYCWGAGNNHAKSTYQNLSQRKRAIQIADLPKTIKQAIRVTQQLGFRYLWIDALCIIQAHSVPPTHDELQDWRNEAPKMGQYYKNAALTIAATATTDNEQGFITERASQKYPVSPCEVGVWKSPNRPFKAVLVPATPAADNQVHYGALYTRGWTLQERVLSRHILHWCAESVFWECQGCITASECNPDLQAAGNSKYVWADALTQPRDSYFVSQFWPDLVEEYCQMALSYESDRLIAIQGLVENLQPSQDEYVAGVFKSGIISGLAWCNTDPKKEKVGTVPSWSWASLSAGNLAFRHLVGRFAVLVGLRGFDVVGHQGGLDGRLKVDAPVQRMHTQMLNKEDEVRVAVLGGYSFKMYFHFDTIGSIWPHDGEVVLFALGWEGSKKDRLVIGLVLWPIGDKAYKRIGVFEVRETVETRYWESLPREMVCIM